MKNTPKNLGGVLASFFLLWTSTSLAVAAERNVSSPRTPVVGGPGRGGGTSFRGGSSGHVPQASARPEAGWGGVA
jgi:hypothetical protein